MFILTILCHVQVIHLLFNRAEAKDSIHELNAAEQMKENMKLKDQMMAKDVEISLLKESLIENGMTLTLFKIVFCHQFQKLKQPGSTTDIHQQCNFANISMVTIILI